VKDVASGLFLLALGLPMAWLTVMQIRKREVAGVTFFDLAGAAIPPLRRPMFWASTIFLGLLTAVALIGAVVFFTTAMA